MSWCSTAHTTSMAFRTRWKSFGVPGSERRGGKLHGLFGEPWRTRITSEVMALLAGGQRTYWWCAADIPRAMASKSRSRSVRSALQGEAMGLQWKHWSMAPWPMVQEDVIWVGGSLFVVGDVLRDAPGSIEGWPQMKRLPFLSLVRAWAAGGLPPSRCFGRWAQWRGLHKFHKSIGFLHCPFFGQQKAPAMQGPLCFVLGGR